MFSSEFQQNRTINEEFDFREVKGGRVPRFQKFGKAQYRMVIPLHTKIFSTLAQLKIVYILRELN